MRTFYQTKLEILKDSILRSYDRKETNHTRCVDETVRGLGKTSFINELALIAKSEGKHVIVIGFSGAEYICDVFASSTTVDFRHLRGYEYDTIVLVDEIHIDSIKDILDLGYKVYGFHQYYYGKRKVV